jgi:hypothetical protein
VLVVNGVSVCHVTVIMATVFEPLDIAVRHMTETERTKQVSVLLGTLCIVCCIFLCLECKIVDKQFWAHVTPCLYGNCVVLFCVVLCNNYRICVGERGMTES